MRDLSRLTKWLNKFPGWLKAGIGLIAGIVSFIIAFRKDWQLYVAVTIGLILVYLISISLYVLVSRLPSKSRTRKRVFHFERHRMWGFAGIGVALLLIGFVIVNPTMRGIFHDAIFGTPTPLPPPELKAADVVISDFYSKNATHKQEVAHRLENDLNLKLQDAGLSQIRVTTNIPQGDIPDQIVKSAEDAQAVVNAMGSKVVIWGWYDDSGIQVNVFLSGGGEPGSGLPGTPEIPLAVEGDPKSEISFVVHNVLPDTVSFLSLFVIGHLEYISNHYEDGRKAFDEAMNNIPANVQIENEALLHFFLARQMDSSLATDVNDVICEYAKAIELDPGFAEAYNNLGVVSSRFIRINIIDEVEIISEPSAAAYLCLQKAGIEKDSFAPRDFYTRALKANPSLTLAEFNDLALEWRTSPPEPGSQPNPYLAKFEDIQKKDPSITGTYIILGAILDSEGKTGDAIQMYEQGTKVDPANASLHFLLGQLYLSYEKDETRAEKELLTAVDLNPKDIEVRLALGNLYYGESRFEKAAEQFDAIPKPNAPLVNSPEMVSRILRSGVSFNQADASQAIGILSGILPEDESIPFLHFLLGLLYQSNGQTAQATDAFGSGLEYGYYYAGVNDTTGLAWSQILSQCQLDTVPRTLGDWVANELPQTDCLPKEEKGSIQAVYNIFHDQVLKRKVVQQPVAHQAECPFVYTYDSQTNEWKFQTTILYRLVNHEATQTRALTHFEGSLLIREEEHEISHINSLYVVALLSDGSMQIFQPQISALQANDRNYVVLHQGDEILIALNGYPPDGIVQAWQVVATGYYVQLQK